jgi:hypothetical protein
VISRHRNGAASRTYLFAKEAIMMRKALALLGAAVVASGPAMASDQPYFREVKGRIELARASMSPFGWRLDQVYTGTLPSGEGGVAKLKLEPGREYRILGRCDDDCEGLDLVLARDGQPIQRDLEGDKLPSLDFKARFTGDYTAAARMVGCEAATCRYGIAVFVR